MTRRALRVATCAVVAIAVGGTVLVRAAHARRASTAAVAAPAAAAEAGFTDRARRDTEIRVWRQALDADPRSALVLGQLAALHLQRAREGGGWDDYVTAEGYARASLGRRTFRNAATASTLVSILLAQHRFTEARSVALDLATAYPEVATYRATLAEVAMELGDDRTADSLFATVWRDRGTLTIAARLSRWLEVNGHVSQARQMLVTARDDGGVAPRRAARDAGLVRPPARRSRAAQRTAARGRRRLSRRPRHRAR